MPPMPFTSLQPITQATSTPCGHTFCRGCIQHWLKRNSPCPCCNFKLHRRLLYEAESIDRIVDEFGKLREAYEQETHESMYGSDAKVYAGVILMHNSLCRSFAGGA